MKVYFKSKLGERKTNEDRHNIILNSDHHKQNMKKCDMFAIYDGHGGSYISQKLSEMMPEIFMNKKIIFPINKAKAMKICHEVQELLKGKYTTKATECGATCLMMFKFKHSNKQHEENEYINIINIGDCRAVLCSGKTAMQITVDHKPLDPSEKQRIMSAGGKVYYDGWEWRVDNLSLSRAFGDITSKFTPPIPDSFIHKISKNDKFIILACDGLWTVVDSQTAVNFVLHFCYDKNNVRINENFDIGKKLADFAITQGSTDNVTVIVVFF